ncbi:MAG: Eco57I restriction-modification methylase domain-containing protein [Candidatus Heimdallarchaeota archaeon]
MQNINQKELGAYYTPSGPAKHLVQTALSSFFLHDISKGTGKFFDSLDDALSASDHNVIDRLDQAARHVTVLDGAVGDGQLILAALGFLSQVRQATNRRLMAKVTTEHDLLRDIVQSNLFGMDIAPMAVQECHENIITLLGQIHNPEKNAINTNIVRNLIQGNFLESTLDDWSNLKGIKGVDIVIGNPPWGRNILQRKEKSRWKKEFNIESSLRNLNVFEIFLHKATHLLAPSRGILGFLLPKNITRSNHYTALREFILSTYQILTLDFFNLFQNVTQEYISLVARKTELVPSGHKIVVDKTIQIPQLLYSKTIDFIFTRDYNSEFQQIHQAITHNSQPLESFITIRRGEELSKKGTIMFCPRCKEWVPFSSRKRFTICPRCTNAIPKTRLQLYHLIKSRPDDRHTEHILTGLDFGEFEIKKTHYFDNSVPFYSKKETGIYKSPKLIFQKIKRVPCAAFDYDSHRTTQNVYNLQLKSDYKGSPEILYYILAIFNSRLIQWYYERQFNLGSRYTNAISIRNLRRFPLKDANLQEGTGFEIVKLSKSLSNISTSSSSFIALREKLDTAVLQHFGLSDIQLPVI